MQAKGSEKRTNGRKEERVDLITLIREQSVGWHYKVEVGVVVVGVVELGAQLPGALLV